jgi:hypothetical protein
VVIVAQPLAIPIAGAGEAGASASSICSATTASSSIERAAVVGAARAPASLVREKRNPRRREALRIQE